MNANAPQGWASNGNGIACNPDPVLGGIIDSNMTDGSWFVIFHDREIEDIEGLDSREEAFRRHREAIESKYLTA